MPPAAAVGLKRCGLDAAVASGLSGRFPRPGGSLVSGFSGCQTASHITTHAAWAKHPVAVNEKQTAPGHKRLTPATPVWRRRRQYLNGHKFA